MKERRFFAPSDCWQSDVILPDSSQSHHIITVLRLKIGNRLICFDETGRQVETQIQSIDRNKVTLEIVGAISRVEQPLKEISLAQALIKPHNMDLLIQKSVELDVSQIIPFQSSYSIIKLDSRREQSKLNRWQKIIIEAVQQCERNSIPAISPVLSFDSLLEKFDEYDKIFVAHPYAETIAITDYVADANSMLVVIGPEGGFSPEEMDLFLSIKNVVGFKFNPNILRAETAALSSMAILQYAVLGSSNSDE